ncbi:DUF2989 domain-containing protein [Pseudoalteromonas piscicida]|uniref:DUF2989 domain-containing protein n=1 Tax=Pseudoalteromonas piscicida TaxID=43662 RepID=UPI000E358852|nr:DUF2989 domain-containing protein [Pseudoalteromonas piscicida]AXQ98226.1 DUF2989 domain-containing protein [Pseudoalteromonas piscicida]
MAFKKSLVFAALLLAGCDDTLTLNQVCSETPGFCEDLNTDSHCKDERASLIYARYHEYKSPTDDNKYDLLQNLESYNQCVSRAAKIEHIKLKEKTTSRVEGHLTALKEMTRIYNETKDSNHPGLLYYHWSRNNDRAAMNKLLNMQDDSRVQNDPEIQLFLAEFYAKVDDDKTVDILYRVLELNKSGHTPNPEVYSSLVSIFYKHEKYKHAYTFARVAQLSGVEDIDIIPVTNQLASMGKDLANLDSLAERTYESIQAGEFVSPRDF